MTYCLGLYLEEGLVLLSDTRTNAGIDHVSTFGKMHVFHEPGQRLISLLSSGNLAVSQAVVHLVSEGMPEQTGSRYLPKKDEADEGELQTLYNVPDMFAAARLVGAAVREVYDQDGRALEQQGGGFQVSFLLGGQIGSAPVKLFQVYAAGNFIEASSDTPFLQIGEHKYGKPILDRAVKHSTPLQDGVKLALISMDSTLRSNLSVGLPADLLVYRNHEFSPALWRRLDDQDPYYLSLRQYWSDALHTAYQHAPEPDWEWSSPL